MRRLRLAAAVVLVCVAFHGMDPVLLPWVVAQLIKCLWPFHSAAAASLQAWSWTHWEQERLGHEFVEESIAELAPGTQPQSLDTPFVVRRLLQRNGTTTTTSMLDANEWLLRPPVSELVIDYFSNASVEDGIVPDARGSLGEVVRSIIAGGSAKIGTEKIFRAFPHLLEELGVAASVGPLLGASGEQRLAASRLGLSLTVPVFMATGAPQARTDLHCEPIGNMALQLGGRKRWTLVPPGESRYLRPTLSRDGRAYFQSEVPPTQDPKGSLAHVRRWVVETDTVRQRPAATPPSAARRTSIFLSIFHQPSTAHRTHICHSPPASFGQRKPDAHSWPWPQGDALWVPTWTWHRVDYLPQQTAVSASLFHFRWEQTPQNSLYTALAVPNVIKELVGWKTQ